MKLFHATLLAALLAIAGCASTQQPNTTPAEPTSGEAGMNDGSAQDVPTFSDVQPLLQDTFVPLLTEDDELDASSWQGLIAGSEHGTVLIPYDADHSLLVEVAEDARATGQAGAPTEEEIARVRQWIEAGAQSDAGEVPYAEASNLLYVANEAGALVTIIDTDENRVVGTVDLAERGFSENAKPHDTAVGPGGEYWYVSLIGANRVLKFNRDNEIVGQVELEVPGMMVLDPASDRLFVGRSMSAVNPPQRIGVIDRAAMTLSEVDIFYPRPHAIAIGPQGRQLYSASLAQNRLATVDPSTNAVAEMTTLGGPVHTLVQFDVAPDGQTMVAGGQISGTLLFFDTSAPPALNVTDSLSLGGQPWHPTYTPDGSRIYVPQKTANAVAVIDAERRTVETTIRDEAIAQPHGSAVRPDGRYVYVSGSNVEGTYEHRYDLSGSENIGTVVVIDTRTNEVVKVLRADQDPSGMSVQPAS